MTEARVAGDKFSTPNAFPNSPLTDFGSGDIYNYNFSSDGKRLYLARGYSTRNAVLIRNFK